MKGDELCMKDTPIIKKDTLKENTIDITIQEEGMKHTYHAEKQHRENRNADFPYLDYKYYKKYGNHYYEVVNIKTKKKIYARIKAG